MPKKILVVSLTVLVLLASYLLPCSAEQAQRDLSAMVVVLPVFKISVDNPNVHFGYVEPGKSVELNPSTYFNEVKCVSNKGKTWYLKLSILGEIRGPAGTTVGVDSFKWMVQSATGDGVLEDGWHPFTQQPVRAYTSGAMDITGQEVLARLKYKLDLPATAKGGNYNVTILYTLSDRP